MATEIDALQLNITGSTRIAVQSIDKLIGSLTKLGTSLGVINSINLETNLANMANGFTNLNGAINSIETAKLKDLSRSLAKVANTGVKLSNFQGIANVNQSLTPINSLINGLERINAVDLSNVGNIKTLADGVSKLSGAKLDRAPQALQGVAEGMRAFTGVNVPALDGIEAFVKNIRGLGSGTIVTAAEALPRLGQALRSFPERVPAAEGLTQFAKALSIMGRKTSENALSVIPRLSVAFRDLLTQLANTPAISSNVVRLTEALAAFLANLRGVGTGSTNAARGLTLFGTTASRTARQSFSLSRAIGKLYATYFLLFRIAGKIRDSINYASDLKEVQNVVDTTFGSAADKVEQFAKTSIESFGLSELSAKKFASRFQAMGVAMNVPTKSITEMQTRLNKIHPELAARGYDDMATSISDLSVNVTKLAADMASFYNVEQEEVAKDLEAIYTGMTRPLRQYGIDLSVATLQEFANKQGIDAKVKSMTQAEKTLLRYQYVMATTSAAQGDFTKTSLTWANQIRILGQNFQRLGQVIGSGLIAWLRPAVVTINSYMNAIINAVTKAVNALGKIFGWQMIVDTSGGVIEQAEDIADAYDDATGSAKKLKHELLGIDELNNLTTNNGGGGGATSGGGAGGLANIIKPGGIEFKPFESDIDYLYELGRRFSEALKNLLPDDWSKIYQKARNFGTGLADFLNGLFQPETFYKVGKTISNSLNTVIEAALAFASRFDFKNFGDTIASTINGFFENFNFKKLAKTLNKWVNGIKTTIVTAIKKINWGKIISGAMDFFGNLDFDVFAVYALFNTKKLARLYGVFKTFGSNVTKVFTNLKAKGVTALTAFDDALLVGSTRTQALNTSLKTISGSFTKMQKGLITVVSAFAEFTLVRDGVKKLAGESKNLAEGITKLFGGLAVGAAGLTLVWGFPAGVIAAGVIGLISAFKGLADAMKEAEEVRFAESMQRAFKNENGVPLNEYINSVSDSIKEMGKGFELMSEKSQNLETAKKNVSDVVFEIGKIKTMMDEGVITVEEGTERLNEKFDELAEAMNVKLGAALDVVLAGFGENGALAEAYRQTGVAVDVLKEQTVQSYTDVEKATAELIEQLKQTPYGTDEWYSIYSDLQELTSGMSETEKASQDLRVEIQKSGLNWDNYFDETTGKLNVDSINESLDSLVGTAKDVSSTFEEESKNLANAMDEIGNGEGAEAIRNGLPDALDYMNEQSAEKIKEATDNLQTDLLDKIPEMVEKAEKDWGDMNPLEKLIKFKGDKDTFIQNRLQEYQTTVIDPLSEKIETSLSALGVEGSGWASDAAQQIMDGIFDVKVNRSDFGTATITTLKKNWRDIIDEVRDSVDGGDITRGLLEGEKNVPTSEYKSVADIVKKTVTDTMEKSFEIHSPAKSMYPIGEYIILGIFEGFKKVDFSQKMNTWWSQEVKPWFTQDKWGELGDGMLQGLIIKWQDFTKAFDVDFDSWWSNVESLFSQDNWYFDGIEKGLTFSFSKAVNAMKDVWTGFAKWFNNNSNLKIESQKLNGKTLFDTQTINFGKIKGYAQGGMPDMGSLFVAGETYGQTEWVGNINGKTGVASGQEITGIAQAIRETSSQEIALLQTQNQYLSGILQKEFGISKKAIGEATRSYGKEFYNRTGLQPYNF